MRGLPRPGVPYKFADFEIDEERRELRLGRRELSLQPRVFDLLAYLIRHRDRVVGKDELLEALWPGTIVVDGALQRVVSLARSALAEGGAKDAIRTYARRGYRFSADTDTDGAAQPGEETSPALERARSAFAANDWDSAIEAFRNADREHALGGADLERLARAAQWIGNAADSIGPLERAIAAYLSQGDRRGAARAALLLSAVQFERLEIPVAKGWLKRAQSLVSENEPCRELGLMHYTAARLALLDGALEASLAHAEHVQSLGVSLADPDLEALGLAYRGHALLSLSEIERGVDALDEAAAAALAGNLTSWVASLVYCSVIWACRNRGDWDRAASWTDQFTRWCERSGLTAFPGTCRLHRAEVLSVRGEIGEAEKEIEESTELLSVWAPWAEGDAYRVLGDLRLAQGELDAAEAAYRKAHALGWDPQPGHSMLQMAQGRPAEAVRSLERALVDRNWANSERRGLLLADLMIAAAAAGELERSRSALAELQEHPELWSGTSVEAVMLHGRAELALREGRSGEAIDVLRAAVKIWRTTGSAFQAATMQLRLAEALLAAGEASAAELELSAVEAAFEKMEMPHWIERSRAARRRL